MQSVLEEVADERRRQDAKWGPQNWNPVEWCAILGEEVGETNKAAVEYWFDKQKDKNAERSIGWLQEYRKELVQVAAVAVAMVESLDRNELKQ